MQPRQTKMEGSLGKRKATSEDKPTCKKKRGRQFDRIREAMQKKRNIERVQPRQTKMEGSLGKRKATSEAKPTCKKKRGRQFDRIREAMEKGGI